MNIIKSILPQRFSPAQPAKKPLQLHRLPDELIVEILRYLKPKYVIRYGACNTRIFRISQDPSLYPDMNSTALRILASLENKKEQSLVLNYLSQTDLENLDLSQINPSNQMILNIIERCKTIKEIKLRHRGSPEIAKNVIHRFMSLNLMKLDLSHCLIKDRIGKIITKALHRNTTLQTLNLSGNKLGEIGFTRSLSKALEKNTTLIKLDLSGTSTKTRWLEGLVNNKGLRSLHLRGCNLNDEDFEMLAKTMENHKTLRTLNVADNLPTSKGAQAFADAFSSNQTLTTLAWHLFSSRQSIQMFGRVLRKNNNLETLRFRCVFPVKVDMCLNFFTSLQTLNSLILEREPADAKRFRKLAKSLRSRVENHENLFIMNGIRHWKNARKRENTACKYIVLVS